MQRWVTTVVELARPLLQPRGNIMMLQIENEHGQDQPYLDWAVDMARNLTIDETVPWNLCHKYQACLKTNSRNGTYDFKALCTMNGFWMEEHTVNPDQPSPRWMNDLRANNPGQPAMWTENQGWFDQWGVAKRVRRSSDQLYGMARWVSWGGSYQNLYMLTGGNNYGLQSGGEVTTAYAPNTVISSLLLKNQPRFDYFKNFFSTIIKYKKSLLSAPLAETTILLDNSTTKKAVMTALVQPCTDTNPENQGSLDLSQRWDLAGGILRTNFTGYALCVDALLKSKPPTLVTCNASSTSQHFSFDTSTGQIKSSVKASCKRPSHAGQKCFQCLDFGKHRKQLNVWDCKDGPQPGNQQWTVDDKRSGLRFAQKSTSCLSGKSAGGGGVELQEYGRLAFLSNTANEPLEARYLGQKYELSPLSVVFVDKLSKDIVFNTADAADPDPEEQDHRPVGSSTSSSWLAYPERLGYGARSTFAMQPHEQLNLTENMGDYLWYSTTMPAGAHASDVSVSTAGHSIAYVHTDAGRLHVLSVAMGLENTNVGPASHKGVVRVQVGDKEVPGPWNHSWVLEGEEKEIFKPVRWPKVPWMKYSGERHASSPVTWLRASFDLPVGVQRDDPEVAFALNLSTMWKGVAYVNGFNLGRYWLRDGKCSDACAPPVKNGHCYMHWKNCGKATQSIYHIPSDVLMASQNLVVIFEESVPPNPRDPYGIQLVALNAREVRNITARRFFEEVPLGGSPSFLQRRLS
jgi:hypothetical protein